MKNFRTVILFMAVGMFALLSTAADSVLVSEKRTLDNFTGVEMKTLANLFLTQSSTQEIKIEGSRESAARVTTTVKNGSLIISSDRELTEPVNIYISVKDLYSIDLSGSGNITMQNQFKNDKLSVRHSGSGKIDASVDIKSLKVVLSGQGDVNAKGRSHESDIKIIGSGNLNGKDLKTFTSTINISGSGTSTVDVDNELTVNITGSGNVFYVSYPERIHSVINGLGKIERIS
jgi:hypothetical protein